MTNVPTVEELAAWLTSGSAVQSAPALTPERRALYQLCIDTAVDDLDDRCWLPSPWPTKVKMACLLLAARLVKRQASPEGVAGFGELGAVRVSAWDSDVERLIGRYLKIEFA